MADFTGASSPPTSEAIDNHLHQLSTPHDVACLPAPPAHKSAPIATPDSITVPTNSPKSNTSIDPGCINRGSRRPLTRHSTKEPPLRNLHIPLWSFQLSLHHRYSSRRTPMARCSCVTMDISRCRGCPSRWHKVVESPVFIRHSPSRTEFESTRLERS